MRGTLQHGSFYNELRWDVYEAIRVQKPFAGSITAEENVTDLSAHGIAHESLHYFLNAMASHFELLGKESGSSQSIFQTVFGLKDGSHVVTIPRNLNSPGKRLESVNFKKEGGKTILLEQKYSLKLYTQDLNDIKNINGQYFKSLPVFQKSLGWNVRRESIIKIAIQQSQMRK